MLCFFVCGYCYLVYRFCWWFVWWLLDVRTLLECLVIVVFESLIALTWVLVVGLILRTASFVVLDYYLMRCGLLTLWFCCYCDGLL